MSSPPSWYHSLLTKWYSFSIQLFWYMYCLSVGLEATHKPHFTVSFHHTLLPSCIHQNLFLKLPCTCQALPCPYSFLSSLSAQILGKGICTCSPFLTPLPYSLSDCPWLYIKGWIYYTLRLPRHAQLSSAYTLPARPHFSP